MLARHVNIRRLIAPGGGGRKPSDYALLADPAPADGEQGGGAARARVRFPARFKSRIQPVILLENFVRTGKRQADRSTCGVAGVESVFEKVSPRP